MSLWWEFSFFGGDLIIMWCANIINCKNILLHLYKKPLKLSSGHLLWYTGCPKKHDCWWIVLNVFFHILYQILNTFWVYFVKKILNLNIFYYNITQDWHIIYLFYYSLWYQTTEQINEEDILNYSSTVMFRGTPCS